MKSRTESSYIFLPRRSSKSGDGIRVMRRRIDKYTERIGDEVVDGFSSFIEKPWFGRVNIGFVIFVWGFFLGYLYFRFQF